VAIVYRDNSLIPKEAIRMAALGALVKRDRPYAEIAGEVRQFAARVVGPSLDLLGTSIELLKLEGLIAVVGEDAGDDSEMLRLTEEGVNALEAYLKTNIRPGTSDLNKLVIALKLRFIDVLDPEDQVDQLEGLMRMYEGEQVRLRDLAAHGEWSEGLMPEWLEIELDMVSRRINWCDSLISRRFA
jgi:DNA-binding PadR family transcriptional regulator